MKQTFIKGVDISILDEVERYGGEFFLDFQKKDLFDILKVKGVNTVRLRLWVNPFDTQGNPYLGGTNDLPTTLKLAKRAKANGMALMLNLHYSDFWTDPKKQQKPKEWADLSGQALKNKVYDYTKEVLAVFDGEGLRPEYIQIGNEITNGMLWPDGKTPKFQFEDKEFEAWEEQEREQAYDQLADLLKAGIAAVREDYTSDQMKIILHLDFGGANILYRTWFDEICQRDVDFDIIGLSYYPYWHGSLADLAFNLRDTGDRFGKDLLIVETAYAFTDEAPKGEDSIFNRELSDIAGYPPTVDGQQSFLMDLMALVKGLQAGTYRGLGIVYWEPAWLPVQHTSWASEEGMKYGDDLGNAGNHWANQGLFDFEGNALESLNVFKLF
ncbi:glycoside hydrolase family 53 protein [Gracilibacillus alcaliphilus]|uniref:glycoside hydrolase family 53 protein n=1 Tax=Gracilibacillus alcaliphilus TaxID=1401441 RepID=UPI00195A8090|nr:glycosyl hydrolase 53 family protein [Gracilibacillus alcaliphilus]MBM7679072.1 arabinogalactan endo-1,4-beta-galactosidase [Gracilibacillus alcaliphilus]